jgi:hypothetical protein
MRYTSAVNGRRTTCFTDRINEKKGVQTTSKDIRYSILTVYYGYVETPVSQSSIVVILSTSATQNKKRNVSVFSH